MKKESKMLAVVLLIVSTGLGAIGQLFFKLGLNHGASIYFSIFLFIGVVAYLVSTFVYLFVLSRMHLSWAYGFNGLAYVFASILAYGVLNEIVTPLRWLGVVVIAFGTILIGLS